jgi:hypothetical protein
MRRLPSTPARSHGRLAAALLCAGLVVGCGAEEAPAHPWLDLAGAPTHEILEVSGTTGGQLVIYVPPESTQEAVVDLGRRIADQAPPNATLNARIFDDRETARNWRTAPADWTIQHLLLVVTRLPGEPVELRWMQPDPALPRVMSADSTSPPAPPVEAPPPSQGGGN